MRGGLDRSTLAVISIDKSPPFSPRPFLQRWGIRDEATREHRTSEICMGEIARCAKAAEGLGPTAVFFLLLLGNRVRRG